MKSCVSVVLVAGLLVFSSCDALLSTNLFKAAGVGQLSADSISAMSSADLAKNADSSPESGFYDTLSSDPSAKAAVLATLLSTYTTSTDPAAVQAAAAATAKIELVTTGANDLVNNLVAVIADPPDLGAMTPASITSLVEALVPADLLTSEAGFSAAIQALLDAQAAYDALGSSIGGDGAAVSGATIGTAAQGALVASVLAAIDLSSFPGTDPDTSASYPNTDAGRAALLYDLATKPSFDATGLDLVAGYDPSLDPNLNSLLVAGGLDLSSFGL